MKTKLYILAAAVVILVCTCVAIVVANDRKVARGPVIDPQVKSLQAQLKSAQDTQKLHDSVNTTAIKNAGDQIILLTNQKATICQQVKAAKLTQPLCQ